ncbi:MAG: bifunctional riboflavin kinase/FAD synthetase, partial [Thermoguttaceae bacterium]|nr:bifunctional riboflavin kinase/FAD synthetase [Thermoguttaceae bacterium]
MEIIDDLDAFPRSLRGCVLTLGKYDGVHLGHQETLRRARDAAQRREASLVVFTFTPSPAQILSPEKASPPLVDEPTKRALLAAAGVDALVNFPTTREFLNLSAEAFFDEIVSARLGAVQMVEGADFSLGRGREVAGPTLDALAKRFGVLIERVAPTTLDG